MLIVAGAIASDRHYWLVAEISQSITTDAHQPEHIGRLRLTSCLPDSPTDSAGCVRVYRARCSQWFRRQHPAVFLRPHSTPEAHRQSRVHHQQQWCSTLTVVTVVLSSSAPVSLASSCCCWLTGKLRGSVSTSRGTDGCWNVAGS